MVKNTGLRRKTPLKRSPMRRRPGSTKHARRERDLEYMGAVAKMPCLIALEACNALIVDDTGGCPADVVRRMPVAAWSDSCLGPVQVDHAGERIGRRAPDDTSIPLCMEHHRQRTENSGYFAKMSKADRWAWRCVMIRIARSIAEARGIHRQWSPLLRAPPLPRAP